MYYVDKVLRKNWDSLSLAYMADWLDLTPKLDSGTMMIKPTYDFDFTQMVVIQLQGLGLACASAQKCGDKDARVHFFSRRYVQRHNLGL
ncbi:DNA polymerase family B domain-containing protein [Penicillium pulvis]|uniref:DNA polymerase family B domain-containing protein n=1 Tax=Penicillium pulvis TaxID=1562058 RepID=UPI002548B229|nr:DNA polymerase family B domain-containing protein [Penicillium pulvis]KAJ5798848.1 DNA polymerase family B domain-containing protein [Penicillium pulvis]